jgi:hypothetical protein
MLNLLKSLFKPQLEIEALEAYFNRLPSRINVSWFRDGKYIVGNIFVDSDRFMTQGRNADEFVNMVNETVYAVYDIPVRYSSALRGVKNYVPKQEEYERLNNGSICKDSFSTEKKKKLQLA